MPHQPPKLSCWNCPICREQGMGPICLEWREDWWSWEAFRVGVQQDGSGQSKWGSFSKKTAFRGLSLLSRARPAFNQIVFDTIADNGLVAAVGDWVSKVFRSLNKGWNIFQFFYLFEASNLLVMLDMSVSAKKHSINQKKTSVWRNIKIQCFWRGRETLVGPFQSA